MEWTIEHAELGYPTREAFETARQALAEAIACNMVARETNQCTD